jgi:hypothetical protein
MDQMEESMPLPLINTFTRHLRRVLATKDVFVFVSVPGAFMVQEI